MIMFSCDRAALDTRSPVVSVCLCVLQEVLVDEIRRKYFFAATGRDSNVFDNGRLGRPHLKVGMIIVNVKG